LVNWAAVTVLATPTVGSSGTPVTTRGASATVAVPAMTVCVPRGPVSVMLVAYDPTASYV
jgi:hypothetical protein